MRVALIHDWLLTYRGGERVLEAICALYPEAEIFTLLHRPGSMPATLERRTIHTSFLQHIPGIDRRHRHFLPLFPWAIESLDLSGFDLILSSSHCVAKGVKTPAGSRHLSYVHAPMRYMWDRFDDYFGPGRARVPVRWAARALRPWLRHWDRRSSESVDVLLANSRNVARKVEDYYGRACDVLHPPVELEHFTRGSLQGGGRGEYFLWLGALAPYKRVDIAIEAFRRLDVPLWIAGAGQEAHALKRHLPANVRVLGHVPSDDLPNLYRNARALILTADEDFGITALEAQASGRPAIAYASGGALEALTPRTAIFFERQTADSLEAAVRSFDGWEQDFSPELARAHASQFTVAAFQSRFREHVNRLFLRTG